MVKKDLQKAILGTVTIVLGCYGYPQNPLNTHTWWGCDCHYCCCVLLVHSNVWNSHIRGGFVPLLFLDGTGTLKTFDIQGGYKVIFESRYISLLDVLDKKVHFVRQIALGLNHSWYDVLKKVKCEVEIKRYNLQLSIWNHWIKFIMPHVSYIWIAC